MAVEGDSDLVPGRCEDGPLQRGRLEIGAAAARDKSVF
jgi:hypothetical protein